MVLVEAVLEERADPYGTAAQTLDIVELVDDAAEVAAVAQRHVARIKVGQEPWPLHIVCGVAVRKAVCQQLVDWKRAPVRRRREVSVALPAAVIVLWLGRGVEVDIPGGIVSGPRCCLAGGQREKEAEPLENASGRSAHARSGAHAPHARASIRPHSLQRHTTHPTSRYKTHEHS